MKVLLISLQKRGGGAIDGLEFSNGLAKNGFRHDAVISAGNEYVNEWNEYADQRDVFKVPTYQSNMRSFLFWSTTLARPIGFLRKVLKIKPDIVHIVDFHPWAIFVFMARPFAKYKIFYAPQDNPFDPKEKNMPFMEIMERFFVKKADVVIAYSEFMKVDIDKYIEKPIEVLPLGVHAGLCPGITNKQFHAEGRLTLLFFGRIEPYKGLDILVRAMDILSKEHMDLELTIAGKGDVGSENLKLIEKLKINFKNYWITDEEICSLVSDADVLIAPYKKATQSGIISVGLACYVPLIVTDVGSFSEYVKDGVNGFLVKSDPRALAEKIKELYVHRELLAEMSRRSAEIAEQFSWKNIAKKAIGLYQKK
jgi:glycosyltransferase involved in cell wall biosynthesis